MADKTPVNVKKDYKVKKPTGMAKEMREAGENMGVKMHMPSKEKAEKIATANMKRETEQSKQVHPNVRRSTSDGYMPSHRELMKDPDYKRQVNEGKQEERVAKSMPKKFEKAKESHKASGPYKTALEAIKSPTFSAMHKARKDLNKK